MSASDLIPSYSFEVSLDGISFSFSKVVNLSGSVDIDTIVDGGVNDAPVILRKPKRNPDILILEKGCYTSVKDTMYSLVKEGTKIASVSITVLRDGKTVRKFYVTNAVVVKREYSELDAMQSSVFIKSISIAHTGLTEIALPFGL